MPVTPEPNIWLQNATLYTALGAVIAAVVSSGVNVIANAVTKELEYKNAFYAKLADIRINAYSSLRECIHATASIWLDDENGLKYCPSSFYNGYEEFIILREMWNEVGQNLDWYNKHTMRHIYTMISAFDYAFLDLEKCPNHLLNQRTKELGFELNNLIADSCWRIHQEMLEDYASLHDISLLRSPGFLRLGLSYRRFMRRFVWTPSPLERQAATIKRLQSRQAQDKLNKKQRD